MRRQTHELYFTLDAAFRGYHKVNMWCRDTDVLFLLLVHGQDLCQEIWMSLPEIWVKMAVALAYRIRKCMKIMKLFSNISIMS